jgi:ribosomal protein S18 acetylase RimI-like enzyme
MARPRARAPARGPAAACRPRSARVDREPGMSVTHPTPSRIEALRRRWIGQEARLRAIAQGVLDGSDWTVHLAGLPYVEEVPPLPGEALGRDLRGADLRRWLAPVAGIRAASEDDAALISGISLEGLTNNTPLDGVTPFPVAHESADDIAVAMRRGDHFLVARTAGHAVGVVRWARRSEFQGLTGDQPYVEISGLAVRPCARRQGVGLTLLAAAEAQAGAAGFGHVLLRTTMELGLVPWYERAGYSVSLVRQLTCPEGPTILDVVMLRRVGAAGAAKERAGTAGGLKAAATRVAANRVPAARVRVSPPHNDAPRRRYRA